MTDCGSWVEESKPYADSLTKSILDKIKRAERSIDKAAPDPSKKSVVEDSTTAAGGSSKKNEMFRERHIPPCLKYSLIHIVKSSSIFLGPMPTILSKEYHLGVLEHRDSIDVVYKLFCNEQDSDSEVKEDAIDKCLNEMRMLLDRVRKWYEKIYTEALSDDELLSIMFHDGCLILSKLLQLRNNDFLFEDPSNIAQLKNELDELLFFTNQIPLFILRTVLNHIACNKGGLDRKAVSHHFSDHWSFISGKLFPAADGKEEMFHCLLHMYHYSFYRQLNQKNEWKILIWCGNMDGRSCSNFFCNRNRRSKSTTGGSGTRIVIPSVTKLQAGVELMGNNKLGEISFRHGQLIIPCLAFSDRITFSMLALEQCQEVAMVTNQMSISMLFYFIACLGVTEDDLKLLDNLDIIDKGGKSDQYILGLFRHVRDELQLNFHRIDCKISQIYEEMKLFTQQQNSGWRNKWWVWWRNLKKNYFSSPWTVISLLAAIVLLITTCTQTFYTVYPYYHPSSH